MQPTEYWINHESIQDVNFSKTFSFYRRINHHYMYLACLFSIQSKSYSEKNETVLISNQIRVIPIKK